MEKLLRRLKIIGSQSMPNNEALPILQIGPSIILRLFNDQEKIISYQQWSKLALRSGRLHRMQLLMIA